MALPSSPVARTAWLEMAEAKGQLDAKQRIAFALYLLYTALEDEDYREGETTAEEFLAVDYARETLEGAGY